MTNFQHQNLASGAWFEMSLIKQLGNIGSEVNRALNWKNKNNQEQMQKALFRALELIYLTVEDKKNLQKLKEILMMRESLCEFFLGENQFNISEEFLRKYFLQLGIAANKKF